MATLKSSKLHFAMSPWLAMGHMTPYLHLSNKLAERGHRVSFLLSRGAQPTMQQLNLYKNLIHFFPLDLPNVDGLPPGAQTVSDVPFSNLTHFATALDQTRDQVETILTLLKPDFVFFDFGCWIPVLARRLGIKSVYYSVVCAASQAMWFVPARKIEKTCTTADELIQLPPGYPSSKVRLRPHEAGESLIIVQELGSGLTLYERLTTGMKECDAIAIRTCPEIEGPFCDYIAQQFEKPVLLTGTVLPESTHAEEQPLEEKWFNWLSKFKPGSVVFCALGSQIILEKGQFQELLLACELAQQPFLVVLAPPQGYTTIEEALPEGFSERVQGRGLVHGGWVPQPAILKHPSIGCFVSHCGFGSMWESLMNDCQIVLVPHLSDQILNTRIMVEELKVAVEVERADNGWFTKEKLSRAIKSVMDDGELATLTRTNHAKWKDIILSQDMRGGYIDSFIQNIQNLLE